MAASLQAACATIAAGDRVGADFKLGLGHVSGNLLQREGAVAIASFNRGSIWAPLKRESSAQPQIKRRFLL